MERRCNNDVVTGEAIYLKLKPMYEIMPDAVRTEHAVAWEVAKMVRKGIRLDVPYAIELAKKFRGVLEEINRELQPVFPPILVSAKPSKPERSLKVVNRNHPLSGLLDPGAPYCPLVVQEFNPASTQQVAYRLKAKYDWKPTAFTPGGAPEVSETTLSGLEYPEAAVFLKYLKASKNLAYVDGKPKNNWEGGGWLHHEKNGRVHPSLNPTGTISHRPSCSKPNLQQVPTLAELRRAFIAAQGRKLVGVDAEGLEMRMLGHYLARHDGGAFAREVVDGDIHTKIMQLVGWDLVDDPAVIKKVCRYNTKSMEYAIIYGAGNPKLGQMAWDNARECGVAPESVGSPRQTLQLSAPSPCAMASLLLSLVLVHALAALSRQAFRAGRFLTRASRPAPSTTASCGASTAAPFGYDPSIARSTYFSSPPASSWSSGSSRWPRPRSRRRD
jgi:DNA polymerase-1